MPTVKKYLIALDYRLYFVYDSGPEIDFYGSLSNKKMRRQYDLDSDIISILSTTQN